MQSSHLNSLSYGKIYFNDLIHLFVIITLCPKDYIQGSFKLFSYSQDSKISIIDYTMLGVHKEFHLNLKSHGIGREDKYVGFNLACIFLRKLGKILMGEVSHICYCTYS